MNKKLIVLVSLAFNTTVFAQTGVNTKDPKANLDVNASTDNSKPDGIISPRVSKADLITKTGLYALPQTSAIVYVTDASAVSVDAKFTNIDVVGYYYFDGVKWQKMAFNKWDLNGNEIEDGQFLGTTNAKTLQFKYNNLNAGFLNPDNTSYGVDALPFTASGVGNVAIGTQVLKSNTTGYSNTAIGLGVLAFNTTGKQNTAIGNNALATNVTASNNTAIGLNALSKNTFGNLNTAVGSNSLSNNTASTANTAVGSNALMANTGASNTAVGSNALNDNTTGANNTALGNGSGGSNTTGAYNIAVGASSLLGNVSGSYNIGIGRSTLSANALSGYNLALGYSALQNLKNTAVGMDYNTAIGHSSGTVLLTGKNNTFLGGNADLVNATGATTYNYATAIGAGATVGQSNSMVLGRSNVAGNLDNIGIGTTAPTTTLHIKAPTAINPLKIEGIKDGAGNVLVIAADGTVYRSAGVTAFRATSSSDLTAMQATIDAQAAQIKDLTEKLDALTKRVDVIK